MSVRLCGRSAGNTWSVNFGNFFCFAKKRRFSKIYGEVSILAYIFQ